MKTIYTKTNSLLGSLIIAFTIMLFLLSSVNATCTHGSHESNTHCKSYKIYVDKYQKLSALYLQKYNYTSHYSYYTHHIKYKSLYEKYKNKLNKCKSNTTSDCDKYKTYANKNKQYADKYKVYADKYLNLYNIYHWSCYKYYHSHYLKKYNHYMNLYNDNMQKYQNCQASNLPTEVCGLIYEDINNNGQNDNDEYGQANIDIKICYTKKGNDSGHGSHGNKHKHGCHCSHCGQGSHGSNNGDTQLVTECIILTTDIQGKYCTTIIPAGEANATIVKSTLPSGSELTAGEDPNTFTITTHQNNDAGSDGYTFPIVVGSLGGKVFEDSDDNGVYTNGEVGAAGIIITIQDSEGNTQQITTTDGSYHFDNVAEGEVTIIASALPNNYVLLDGSTLEQTINITSSLNTSAEDIGYTLPVATGSIHGTVYKDRNDNGLKDSDETGASGIRVTITDRENNTFTVYTDDNGDYNQSGLAEGLALVIVDATTLPSNTKLKAGENPSTVTVARGEDKNAGDDGYVSFISKIEFYIFLDMDEDRIFNHLDMGISLVDIKITDSNNQIHDIKSNSKGLVSIVLPLGETHIEIDEFSIALDSLVPNVGESDTYIENLLGTTILQNHGFVDDHI